MGGSSRASGRARQRPSAPRRRCSDAGGITSRTGRGRRGEVSSWQPRTEVARTEGVPRERIDTRAAAVARRFIPGGVSVSSSARARSPVRGGVTGAAVRGPRPQGTGPLRLGRHAPRIRAPTGPSSGKGAWTPAASPITNKDGHPPFPRGPGQGRDHPDPAQAKRSDRARRASTEARRGPAKRSCWWTIKGTRTTSGVARNGARTLPTLLGLMALHGSTERRIRDTRPPASRVPASSAGAVRNGAPGARDMAPSPCDCRLKAIRSAGGPTESGRAPVLGGATLLPSRKPPPWTWHRQRRHWGHRKHNGPSFTAGSAAIALANTRSEPAARRAASLQ